MYPIGYTYLNAVWFLFNVENAFIILDTSIFLFVYTERYATRIVVCSFIEKIFKLRTASVFVSVFKIFLPPLRIIVSRFHKS